MAHRKIKILLLGNNDTRESLQSAIAVSEYETYPIVYFSDLRGALSYLGTNEVDIIFIENDVRGFDMPALAMKVSGLKAKIVIISSNEAQAFDAYKLGAFQFVLKPLTKNSIEFIFDQFLLQMGNQMSNRYADLGMESGLEQARSSSMVFKYPSRILISNVQKITVLDVNSLMYILAQGPYCEFNIENAQKVTSSKNLSFYSDLLTGHPKFMRIHRSAIINKSYLRAIRRDRSAMYALMANDFEIKISNTRWDEIYNQLVY